MTNDIQVLLAAPVDRTNRASSGNWATACADHVRVAAGVDRDARAELMAGPAEEGRVFEAGIDDEFAVFAR